MAARFSEWFLLVLVSLNSKMYGALSRLAALLAVTKARDPTVVENDISARSSSSDCCSLNIGYDPVKAADQPKRLSTHSWEYGTAAEALLELYNPELSVFSPNAFPNDKAPKVDVDSFPALCYARRFIELDRPNGTLIDGDGATGDPASLGVSALMIGQSEPQYLQASSRQFSHLNNSIPRWPNGAMSHREAYPELWADFIAMAPPFIAYYAFAADDSEAIKTAIMQCFLYRQVLKPNDTGLWKHIVGPENQDLGLWSTGNGWAAYGMLRVLAALCHVEKLKTDSNADIAKADLFHWVGEILNSAMRAGKDENGLLRNYLDDETWFGETSGTSLLTAAVYRLAVLQREEEGLFEKQTKGVDGEVVRRPVS